MGLAEIQALKERAKLPKEKKQYTIPKKSAKKIAQEKEQTEQVQIGNEMVKGNAELQRWFEGRRKEMKGVCANCGGKSCKDSDKYFKFSIAHLLPKAYFKSVATHPDNWIELCYFGKSCHTNLDNLSLDITDLSCFDSVIEKVVKIYPSIAKEERRRIPKVLLEYIEVEK
jgi:hypothetical protein